MTEFVRSVKQPGISASVAQVVAIHSVGATPDLRTLAPHTQAGGYIRAVRKFARYLNRSPDTGLGSSRTHEPVRSVHRTGSPALRTRCWGDRSPGAVYSPVYS
jgi:hypothetical protein